MRRGKRIRWLSLLIALAILVSLLAGCGTSGAAKEESETITVYMWSNALYEKYAPYVQAQVPDVNIQFVVGNNDLDFYKFLNEHGALPDIITCRRFALHDAADLKDSLMDLSTTEEAGTVYDAYITNFTNADNSVNWLPLCAEVDGLVANREVFEKYNIPLPDDYESFVSACQAFEELGVRGFVADYVYDYTCMELLQSMIIPELTAAEGRRWRTKYEDPRGTEPVGLDDTIWPEAFRRLEQFFRDTKQRPEDVEQEYSPVIDMFTEGKVAMIRAGGSNTVWFNESGIDAVFLPYFGQNGEQWLLTYPQFQVALNRELETDSERQEKAMRVLNAMLSEGAQNVLAGGEDVLTYNRNVNLQISPYLANLQSLIDQNHLYIRIASNDFFAVSKDVVPRMLVGEYDAQQAYEAFNTQLTQPKDASAEPILTVDKGYSNIFYKDGGSEAYSVMAATLRGHFGSDVLIASADSFTGSVIQADYTEKQVGAMIMPNTLLAYHREMTGAELKETVKAYVEGIEGGFKPFNRGSLPTVSGITIKVKEENGGYTLTGIQKDGKRIRDDDVFRVTCLNTGAHMAPFLVDENRAFEQAEQRVRLEWTDYIKNGGSLALPEKYIILK